MAGLVLYAQRAKMALRTKMRLVLTVADPVLSVLLVMTESKIKMNRIQTAEGFANHAIEKLTEMRIMTD